MSSVTSTRVKIDTLECSSNYEAWKQVIEAVLIREELWEIVIGEPKEPELPEAATTRIPTPTSQLSEEARNEAIKANTIWKKSARHAYATLTQP